MQGRQKRWRERQERMYEDFLLAEDDSISRKIKPQLRLGVDEFKRSGLTIKAGYHNEVHSYYGRVHFHFGRRKLTLRPNSKILDWGCSKGFTTIELANTYPEADVTGIEVRGYLKPFIDYTLERTKANGLYLWRHVPPSLRRSGIRIGREMKLPGNIMIGDGFHAPFPDESFDAVLCTSNFVYAIPLMPPELVLMRTQQILRLVKPNGYLTLSAGKLDYSRHNESDAFSIILRKDEDGVSLERSTGKEKFRMEMERTIVDACDSDILSPC